MSAAQHKPWPARHLESVPHCPVCASAERELRHEGLTDETFFTAGGEWNLWQCCACNTGWLDPRPDEASIGDAYGHYYTHDSSEPAIMNTLRRKLANGYRNWRYGTKYSPALTTGAVVAALFPARRHMADLAFRLLPRAKGPNLRLLDYGCGGGEYLQLVANAGWRGYGVEPDPQARQIAISRGFDVRASLGEFDGEAFGYVTISHVIEHVHWPAQVIARLFEMTVPHGGLFIATPNMDAVGHDIYGRNWRGLETPRHLVIPTRRSLQAMVERAGYNSLKFHRSKGALGFTALQSRRIACRADPYDDHAPAIARQPTRHETREADGNRTKAEFLILTARKA